MTAGITALYGTSSPAHVFSLFQGFVLYRSFIDSNTYVHVECAIAVNGRNSNRPFARSGHMVQNHACW